MSGPLPGFLAPITVPASWAYERIIEARNRKCDRGVGVERLGVPVISVGNITTGGTGKTPMVMWIAELLQSHGRHPAIALRGYRATNEHPSDEALEYAARLPDVPLIVDPDRASACRAHLESHPHTDCIILDDGFQHRRLHRDLDLVLIDATRDTFNERMIPAGHLREPARNLARADAVIITRAESDLSDLESHISNPSSHISNLESQIQKHHGAPPLALSRHTWRELHIHSSSHATQADSRAAEARGLDHPSSVSAHAVPIDFLRNKRLVTLLGVGNPQAVIDQLEAAGAIVSANIPARDHERFTIAKLAVARTLCEGSDGLVMTGKDWMRSRELIDLADWPAPIIVPQLAIDIVEGREALEHLTLSKTEPRP